MIMKMKFIFLLYLCIFFSKTIFIEAVINVKPKGYLSNPPFTSDSQFHGTSHLYENEDGMPDKHHIIRNTVNVCSKIITPMNSGSICTNSEHCLITCKPGFYAESGQESVSYICKNSQWVQEYNGKSIIEKCEPKCQKPCLNGGKCVMPNFCQCSLNFYGPSCEFEKKPCLSTPPTPMFSFKKCSAENCSITCMPGKKFPDGSTSLELFCKDGKWISSKKDWSTIPNCQPVCSPPCKNGGKCVEMDTCFCPEEFRGKHCEFHISACDVSKLNFNGNYKCNGNEEKYSCKLSCPSNADPDEAFLPEYTCLYNEGKFKPEKIPQCKIAGTVVNSIKVSQYQSNLQILTPIPTTCMIWGGSHLRTLNNRVLHFNSDCLYTVLQDDLQHLFNIQAEIKENTVRKLIIYINNAKYEVQKNAENKPVVIGEESDRALSVPCQLTDLKVEVASGKSIAIYFPSVNLYMVWNLEDEIQIDVNADYWNRTSGLCGRGSVHPLTPMNVESYFRDAAASSLLESCKPVINDRDSCQEKNITDAQQICDGLKSDEDFSFCRNKISVEEYITSCQWAYCNCKSENRLQCVCKSIEKYVEICQQLSDSDSINWREKYGCNVECPLNEVYTSCVPVSQSTCTANEVQPSTLRRYCEEGCICQPGTVLHEDKCIKKENCPCTYGGKFFETNRIITQGCNNCECKSGKWSCTEAVCKSSCLIYGDVHFKTFDGKKFNFLGSCSYTLLTNDNISIHVDYSNSLVNRNRRLKNIYVRINDKNIILNNADSISMNGKDIEKIPFFGNEDVYIRRASSILTQVVIPNVIVLNWDFKGKLQIYVDSSLLGKTKGLCGTYNNNQQDDQLTPEGDVEQNLESFANKWKTNEKCVSYKIPDFSESCDIFVQNKRVAEIYCANLTSPLFQQCNEVVNPQDYLEACMSDMCACKAETIADCLCPAISAYAEECASRGIVVNWRSSVRTCGIPCPNGQQYEICGSSCQRTCSDISHGVQCLGACIEGCFCPSGFTLNEENNCIPINECPCEYKGQKKTPGFIDIRNNEKHLKACECKNAIWECREASDAEIEKHNRQTSCSSPNTEYVECEPPEPLSCKNMHNAPQYSAAICVPGCVCKKGYVLETVTKQCIKPNECPCHHGGKSFTEGEIIFQDCNNCTCSLGRWVCTEKECPATCTSWGDSHFRTFDGQFYDFQGTCDYLFAEGKLPTSETFSVSVQIVPCGTGGTSCVKSVSISVTTQTNKESITLNKDLAIGKKSFKKMELLSTGLYIMVVLKSLSVTLIWDQNTRVVLQVHPMWKNKITGLCGNYNGNAMDDFQTPSGGLIEALPSVFADSWKLQQHCPFPITIEDTCLSHPHRKFWSVMKCSHLKNNPIFKKCHSHVPVEDFYKRCVFDSCACDEGGDCECICTSFAAYAHECNLKGVQLKWRRQDICPIQCEAGTTYSACMYPCPVKSCNNLGLMDTIFDHCLQLPCVEGCEKKQCADGSVFRNSSSLECISPINCKCMNIDGNLFQENEKISEDECHICFCSKGKKVCNGLPCIKSTPSPLPDAMEKNCVNGWSEWFQLPKNHTILIDRKRSLNMTGLRCPPSTYKKLECRQKNNGAFTDWKKVFCEFNSQITCKEPCTEFEYRIECNCGTSVIITTNVTITTTIVHNIFKECAINCDQICHHYKNKLQANNLCLTSKKCLPAYVNATCPIGKYWRDEETCVSKDACTCASYNGTLIRPSTIVEENDCSTCQCINNEYVCTPAQCSVTGKVIETTIQVVTETNTEEFVTPAISLTPLPVCADENFIPIDDEATYNSSSNSPDSSAELSKLSLSSGGKVENENCWRSEIETANQYLDVDLGRIRPVYGIIISGNPIDDEYVKSLKILYSSDGAAYSYVAPIANDHLLFRGPHDHLTPETAIFGSAVEARYLRLKPKSWHKWIAILIQVLGCDINKPTSTPPAEVCNQPLDLGNGKMHSSQVTVSSQLNRDFIPIKAALNSSSGWAPFLASSDQWIQFDFLSDSIIVGVRTKGTSSLVKGSGSWIEAYKIKYSSNGINWHPILNKDKSEKTFSGNYDSNNVHLNSFNPPLKTRYLRLHPIKWTKFPSLRIEVLGCFHPYPEVNLTRPSDFAPPNVICNTCHGIVPPRCECTNNTLWDGEKCVKSELCPCIDGLLTYPVGTPFVKSGCKKCTCTLGGVTMCHDAADNCFNCTDKGLLRVINDDCSCECQACVPGTRLCPNSNVCLKESWWCNGLKECADDEIDCVYEVKNITNEDFLPNKTLVVNITETSSFVCPVPSCPPGYSPVFNQLASKPKMKSLLFTKQENIGGEIVFNKTVQISTHSERMITPLQSVSVSIERTDTKTQVKPNSWDDYLNERNSHYSKISQVACKDWTCVVSDVECSKPKCPAGSKIVAKWTGNKCPTFECLVPPPTEKECSINGRIIKTFDGLIFKYDICDHILAEDKLFHTWSVRKTSKCTSPVEKCISSLIIKHGKDNVEFFANLTTIYNGYKYSLPQLHSIGKKSKLFVVQQVSNNFVIFASTDLMFSVVWSSTGFTRVIVDSSLNGMVDGLCGLFDFRPENDKQKPDGTAANNTQDFGNSWNVGNAVCNTRVCPKDVQAKAKDICNIFKLDPFGICDFTIDVEDEIAKCYESVCMCAVESKDFENDCRCSVLQQFATKCLSAQPGADLSTWRLKYDCPVNCTAPLVYRDCYDRICEPGCESLVGKNSCPRLENRCFPGCYCPEGLIRKDNTCIKATECRDCACNGNGISKLTTFDQAQIPLDGFCSSNILLQTNDVDTDASHIPLKIILTNAPCVNPTLKGVCSHGLTVIVDNKEILLAQSQSDLNSIKVKIGNKTLNLFPYSDNFVTITEIRGISVTLSISSLQLDVTFMSHNKGFSIKMPSSIYSKNSEGLCGSCNGISSDDVKTRDGNVSVDYKEILRSWRTNYTADTEKLDCVKIEQNVRVEDNFTIGCVVHKENDPCNLLLKKIVFGRCHAVVDVSEYFDMCHSFTCKNVSFCPALEAYALECQKNGICLQWRNVNTCPFNCPQGLMYEACSIGCEMNCDTYEKLINDPSSCQQPLAERCVCPEGEILLNGECASVKKCRSCDGNKHVVGDTWSTDNCTMCVCKDGGDVQCQRKQCPLAIICPVNMIAQIDDLNDDPCCTKHVCIHESAHVNCTDPVRIECGNDQVTKLEITSNNCTRYVCVCIPREECPIVNIENDVELLPGMIRKEKKEGCCPSVDIVCDSNTCPEPIVCPQYYSLKASKSVRDCCPSYKCELPLNSCLHKYRWIADVNGSERERLPSEDYTELKQIGDVWFDGPCHTCSCTNETEKSVCSVMKCEKAPEKASYVLQPVYRFGDCCPTYKEIACKVNEKIHLVNSSWTVDGNPCVTQICAENPKTGEISIKEIVSSCPSKCDLGWEYMEPENKTELCCGSCRQVACVDGIGHLRPRNTTWNSDDGCVKFECDNELKIVGFSETCPDISKCAKENIYEDKCCKKCNLTSESQINCGTIRVPRNNTIKLINKHYKNHGYCENLEEIEAFTKCDGVCGSNSFFDEQTSKYSSICHCCVGSHFRVRNIQLTCNDGYKFTQEVKFPFKCHCKSCGDSSD